MATFLQANRVELSPQIAKTLKNTFLTIAGMMGITSISAYLTAGLLLPVWGYLILIFTSFGVLFLIHRYQQSVVGLWLLGAYSVLSGVIIGPILTYYLSLSAGSSIVMTAAGLSAFVCLACVVAVKVTGKSFSNLNAFLAISTLVLMIGYVISWFTVIPALSLGVTILGVVVFSGWLLIEMGRVMTGAQTNYIMAACHIYLSLLSLFIFLLRLISSFSKE